MLKTISKKEWDTKKKHGYASIMENGNKAILDHDPKYGTVEDFANRY